MMKLEDEKKGEVGLEAVVEIGLSRRVSRQRVEVGFEGVGRWVAKGIGKGVEGEMGEEVVEGVEK